jgi:predicted nucleic acid-binding protein
MRRVLADTGPLVAILSPRDHNHELCVSVWKELSSPLLTCWPVVTEAAWLMRDAPRAFKQLLDSIQEGILEMPSFSGAEAGKVSEILEQYASLRPQFADAALVYLAHRENIETIFTLDRRDFLVYRTARKKPFRLLPE